MKVKTVTLLLTFVHLLLVKGLDSENTSKNDATNSSRRVINGQVANPADFQFLVRLHNGDILCGGTVISNHFILSAAHCIVDNPCSDIEIFPSVWTTDMTPRFHPIECYVSDKFIRNRVFYYDIGLIKTQQDLLLHEDIKKLDLPPPGFHYDPGTPAVVVGWGTTEEGIISERLLRADVLVEDWNTCNYKYKHSLPACVSDEECPVPDIPRRGICTQGQGPRPPSTCHGDSGGPLIINGAIAGVTIGTILEGDTCSIGTPSLYTNVVEYLRWIYSTLNPGADTEYIPVVEEAV